MELVDKAQNLLEAGKFAEAALIYDQLLTQNHANPWLHAALGSIYVRENHTVGTGLAMLRFAADKLGKEASTELLSNLGVAYRNSGQTEQAIKWFEKALAIKPTAGTLTNYGSLYVEQGNPERAVEIYRKAIAMDPSIAMAHWNMSLSLLELGQWAEGWDEYEYGEAEGGVRIKKKHVSLPTWDGSPGKKVIIYGEQGIGDEIMFSSMIPDVLKTNEVVLDCHPRLCTLFEKSFGVKTYGTRKNPNLDWIEQEKPDAMCAIGGLGKFYRRSKEAFPGTPYLHADSAPKGKKFRVGISWTGGRMLQRIARRTIPLSWWGSIFSNDCEFISLQYTDGCEEELEILKKSQGTEIPQHPAAKADDYYDLAKVVKSCDLIITVCTSLVHLAGALGVPTWVMVPRKPAWRYGAEGGMRWYKSVRLYRQPEHDEAAWIPVVQRVGLDLSDLLRSQAQKAA